MMDMYLDHFLVGVADLEAAAEWFTSNCGVTPAFGGVHPKLGTANNLVSLGDGCYLELIGPIPGEKPRDLGKALSDISLPELFWFAARSSSLSGHMDSLKKLGMQPAGPFCGKRRSADGIELSWEVLEVGQHPFGGSIPFMIDWKNTPHPSRTVEPAVSFVSFNITHPQADDLQRIYRRIGLALPVRTGVPQLELTIETPLGSKVLAGTGYMPWFKETKSSVLG